MKSLFNGQGSRLSYAVKKMYAKRGQAMLNRRRLSRLAQYSVAPLLTILAATGIAHADDLMAPGQQTVTDTFGENSSVALWIILGEVIFGAISYIRTKNIMLLFGVAVVIVFTTIGFSLAS